MKIDELLSFNQQEIKQYIKNWENPSKEAVLLFASKLIHAIDNKTIQNSVENNIEVREALHSTYQNIEDVLEPNCITRVGDLLEDKQVRASILMNAAKAAKKQGIKFDPSPYIPNYECYNRKLHGEPIPYLKKYFGEFLASCNEEKVNYLYSGDIALIDSLLWGFLYRNYAIEFKKNISKAGKKSADEINRLSKRWEKKLNKIISLANTSRQ